MKLEDGRHILVSAHHPTADGRSIIELKTGEEFDGSRIEDVHFEPYFSGYTYDLLPAGETGLYWANGILLASTLKK